MIKSIDSNWTLFLDRDGVINERNFDGYITSVDEFKFIDGSLEAIVGLSTLFSKIIVVTNQQGVGKKIMSIRNLNDIHRYMKQKVSAHGGKIDAVFQATCLKEEKENRRKPNSKMALEAMSIFPDIDFKKSVMVGDTDGDIKFGTNLGMKTVLVRSKENVNTQADMTVDSLHDFYHQIKNYD